MEHISFTSFVFRLLFYSICNFQFKKNFNIPNALKLNVQNFIPLIEMFKELNIWLGAVHNLSHDKMSRGQCYWYMKNDLYQAVPHPTSPLKY